MSSRREEDNDVVWGMVNDGLIYHRVNAGEPRALIGRGQKQLPIRVDLPHHELIDSTPRRRKNLLSICRNFNVSTLERFQSKIHVR